MTLTPFTTTVKTLLKQIPAGKVVTYGTVALAAGNPRAARQVARILHACSRKDNLPWHRVVNRHGRIALQSHASYSLQKQLLEDEGIVFGENDTIDLDLFLWSNSGDTCVPAGSDNAAVAAPQ